MATKIQLYIIWPFGVLCSSLLLLILDIVCVYCLQAPIDTPVSSDKFWFLTKDRAFSLPSPFDNKGNYVIR